MQSTRGRRAPDAGAALDATAARRSVHWPVVATASLAGPLSLLAGVLLLAGGTGASATLGGVALVALGVGLALIAFGAALDAGADGRR